MLSSSCPKFPISTRFLHRSMATNSAKKFIRIDISSDTVCPWCFVGKRNLDKAIALANDQYDFEIRWHPYLLNPSAPKEGVNKKDHYRNKFGPRSEQMTSRMTEVFKGLGLEYNMSGLTGSSLDSHKLLYFAGQQGLDKQNNLAEELFLGYFTQGRYIGDRKFLLEAARTVGVEGAADFLEDPNNGLKEVCEREGQVVSVSETADDTFYYIALLTQLSSTVNEELQQYSSDISGVPHFVLNGKYQLSGGQPPESFIRAFQAASNITA